MATDSTPAWLTQAARAVGFCAVGVARAEPMDAAPLRAWLEAGYGADMAFLHRHTRLRENPETLLHGAQSVICVALAYDATESDTPSHIARYAQGRNYISEVTDRLEVLWSQIEAYLPGARHRANVGFGPLPERELARRAGLGWVARNCLLIIPGVGSRVVLGEIVTDAVLPSGVPLAGDCGDCNRCVEACPTGALLGDGTLDARRCISYLTIENRGAIPEDLRPALGTRMFGCDACQDVCPYNEGVTPPAKSVKPREEVTNLTPDDVLLLDEDSFAARLRDTALLRPRREGLARNACVALGNMKEPRLKDIRVQLLKRTLNNDPSSLVREHASWALERLE